MIEVSIPKIKNESEIKERVKEMSTDRLLAICNDIYKFKYIEGVLAEDCEFRRFAEELGFKNLPVIIAKTQYSLSDDATLIARPENFTVSVRDIEIRNGAGFIVAIAGKIMLMPGLPAHPAAENIDVDADGNISGLF